MARGGRWYVVALLCVLYVVSYIDRLIITLIAEPMKADLALSDIQIGILIGPAFAFVYSLLGLPVAYLVDRGRRIWLAAAGVAIWSMATIAGAFAHDFSHFLALRTGVALGEAVLSPVAVSLIADYFGREERATPTTIFFTAGVTGVMLASLVGGGLIDLATRGWFDALPGVGGLAAWRQTLVLVGLPGLVIAAILLITVGEPARGRLDTVADADAAGQGTGAFVTMRDAVRFYACFFVGNAIFGIATFATIAWFPAHLIRRYGVTAAQAGYLFGATLLVGAVFALAVPMLAERVARRGRTDALIPIELGVMVVGTTLFLLAMRQDSLLGTVVLLELGYGLLAGIGTLSPIAVALTAPPAFRGRLVAVSLALISVIGLGGGSLCVAFLTQNVFSGPDQIGRALFAIAAVVAPIALLLISASWKPYARAMTAVADARHASAL